VLRLLFLIAKVLRKQNQSARGQLTRFHFNALAICTDEFESPKCNNFIRREHDSLLFAINGKGAAADLLSITF
jgi:hypothetical protein